MRVILLQAGMWSDDVKGFKAPLGLASLASYVRSRGHDVKALDLNYPPTLGPFRYMIEDPDIVRVIRDFNPGIVGISCCSETRHNARFWARLLKQRIPKMKIAIGGPHVSLMPEQVLASWTDVDYVVSYEGEKPFELLLEALDHSTTMAAVPSLTYRDESGGIKSTQRCAPIADLDSLPFPDIGLFHYGDDLVLKSVPIEARYDLFDGPMAHVMTSRGCPFRCKFCSTSHFWTGAVRYRSPANVVEELKAIRKRWPSVANLAFHDDAVTIKRSHIEGICELMLKDNLSFRWVAWSRLDGIDRELLQLMKRAGCVYLKFGVESGTPHGLELVGKKLKLEIVPEKVALMGESGIEASYSFISGIPGETEDEAMETVRLRPPLLRVVILDQKPDLKCRAIRCGTAHEKSKDCSHLRHAA